MCRRGRYGDIRRNGVGTSTLVGEGVRPVASFDEAESPAFMHGEYVKLIRLGGRTVLAGAAAWWEQLDTACLIEALPWGCQG